MKKILILALMLSPLTVLAQQQANDYGMLLGGLVQSDRWIIHKDSAREEFIGNVFYENDNYTLKADYGVSNRKSDTYRLKGNIFASQTLPDSKAEITADELFYNHKKDTGYILPKKNKQVDVSYVLPTNTFLLYGNRVDFKNKLSHFTVTGNTELQDFNNTIYAEQLTYDLSTGIFTAQGNRPVIWGFADDGDYAVQADTITALTKEKVYKAQGRVEGWIVTAKDFTALTNPEQQQQKGKKKNGTKIK